MQQQQQQVTAANDALSDPGRVHLLLLNWFVAAHVSVSPQQQQASATNEPTGRPAIMSAWTLGDSKRLWHSLTKPLSIKYTEAEQQLEMQLTYINNSDFKVSAVCVCYLSRERHGWGIGKGNVGASGGHPKPHPHSASVPQEQVGP